MQLVMPCLVGIVVPSFGGVSPEMGEGGGGEIESATTHQNDLCANSMTTGCTRHALGQCTRVSSCMSMYGRRRTCIQRKWHESLSDVCGHQQAQVGRGDHRRGHEQVKRGQE